MLEHNVIHFRRRVAVVGGLLRFEFLDEAVVVIEFFFVFSHCIYFFCPNTCKCRGEVVVLQTSYVKSSLDPQEPEGPLRRSVLAVSYFSDVIWLFKSSKVLF